MARVAAVIAILGLGAPVRDAQAATRSAYPFSYRVIPEEDLQEMERDANRANPGWELSLEATGLLSRAVADGPLSKGSWAPLTVEDRARAERFLDANQFLVGGNFRAMTLALDAYNQLVYNQIVAGVVVGGVNVSRAGGDLVV